MNFQKIEVKKKDVRLFLDANGWLIDPDKRKLYFLYCHSVLFNIYKYKTVKSVTFSNINQYLLLKNVFIEIIYLN